MSLPRKVLDEELNLVMARGVINEVEVVEQDDDVLAHGRQRVHQCRQHVRHDITAVRGHESGEIVGQNAAGPLERRGDVRPQSTGIVVTRVEGDPGRGRRTSVAREPLGDESGLAKPAGAATKMT